jgi:anti-sigma regulatory factor (Ser/Thr protein kinase)
MSSMPFVCVDRSLPSRASSVTRGRHLLSEALTRAGISDVEPGWGPHSDALLIVSELLANAALVCTGPITYRVELDDNVIRIAVGDDSPHLAAPRQAGDAEISGRGLTIVAAIASQWGQRPLPGGGKEVWAIVLVDPSRR